MENNMMSIGIVQSISGYTARVKVAYSESEVEAVMLLPFVAQALTILQLKQGTQVLMYLSEERNVILGALPSDNEQAPSEFVLESVLKLIAQLQVPTPAGLSGTPIPTNTTEIERLQQEIKKITI